MSRKYAILMDGGFVTKVLEKRLKHFPNVADVETECNRIKAHDALKGYDLLRIYFYNAPPASKTLKNPVDGSIVKLGQTQVHVHHSSLFDALELRPDFALRMGETMVHGWKLGSKALENMSANPRQPTAKDFVPNIEQKGVDLRIGLDIARLALRELVDAIVVVTGDSDFVPAFKFARREGIRVYLDHMGHGVRRELKVHADLVLPPPPRAKARENNPPEKSPK